MKIAFVGPSAPEAERLFASDHMKIAGPAAQGDIAWAVLDGVTGVGLIDGTFETNATVWHKEILFALSRGVRVFGAASLGALRAAECAPYGMIGVGEIFEDILTGRLVDDAALAVIHAPRELGYAPLAEALVNVVATTTALRAMALISKHEESALLAAAKALFFKERTRDRIVDELHLQGSPRDKELRALLAIHRVDQKNADAKKLLVRLSAAPDERVAVPVDWQFNETPAWRAMLGDMEKRLARGGRSGPEQFEQAVG